MIKQLNEKVTYIGEDNCEGKIFESQYSIPDGISYNSYIIEDEKIAILDTIDPIKGEQWKSDLLEILKGRTPDYLVVHHMEPDHSSLIEWVVNKFPSIKVVASPKALQMIPQFFEKINLDNRTIAVKEGDTIALGRDHSLCFYAAPMVHWPEVMVSFDKADGALYSADGFGKFGALCKCGFYGSDDSNWKNEARRYYLNIVGKYGIQVQNLLKKAATLPIKTIRPLHGPILEDDLIKYIQLYDKWSKYEPEVEGVLIAVASIHGGTMVAAEKLKEIFVSRGCENVIIRDLCRSDMADNVAQAFVYSHIILAAASYDAGVFTPMSDYIHRLQAKGLCNRKFGIIENGSWAPSAARVIKESLATLKNVSISDQIVTLKSRMKLTDIPALEALADSIF